MPAPRTLADSDSLIETPEGIELAMPLADPVARLAAFAIDFMLRLFIVWALALVFATMGGSGVGLFFITLFVTWWGYYIICEMLMNGASPGKKMLKLRVVNDDFTPINFSASLMRNLLRTADAMPGFYGLAALTMLFNSNNKRLGDIAAKTIVVHTHKQRFRSVTVVESALPPTEVFTQDEQRSIIEFARYYETHSEERSNEIAYHLSDALKEPNVTKLVNKLRRYAKWFLGESR